MSLQPPTPPGVAVLLVGGLRNFTVPRAEAFAAHVLEPVVSQGAPGVVDLFGCFEPGSDAFDPHCDHGK